jgi:hypothetical protein
MGGYFLFAMIQLAEYHRIARRDRILEKQM